MAGSKICFVLVFICVCVCSKYPAAIAQPGLTEFSEHSVHITVGSFLLAALQSRAHETKAELKKLPFVFIHALATGDQSCV